MTVEHCPSRLLMVLFPLIKTHLDVELLRGHLLPVGGGASFS